MTIAENPDRLISTNYARMLPDPFWLIGKRIKVWWEGNQAYLEADVEGFDCEKRLHKLIYLDDGDERVEDLVSMSVDWQWLDEEREELSIKKREKPDTPFDMPPASKFSVPTVTPISATAVREIPVFRRHDEKGPEKVRRLVTFDFELAYFLMNNQEIIDLDAVIMPDEEVVVNRVSDFLRKNFSVTAFLPRTKHPTPGLFTEVVLFGIESNIQAVTQLLKDLKKNYQRKKLEEKESRSSQVLFKQGIVLTNDWRHYIDTPTKHITKFRHPNMIGNDALHTLGAGRESLLKCVSLQIRKAFVLQVRGLIFESEKNGKLTGICSIEDGLHVVSILHRALSLHEDSQVIDTVAFISACFLLVSKSGGSFKAKTLPTIVHRVYCRVFSRDYDMVDLSSLDSYIQKCVIEEASILQNLH